MFIISFIYRINILRDRTFFHLSSIRLTKDCSSFYYLYPVNESPPVAVYSRLDWYVSWRVKNTTKDSDLSVDVPTAAGKRYVCLHYIPTFKQVQSHLSLFCPSLFSIFPPSSSPLFLLLPFSFSHRQHAIQLLPRGVFALIDPSVSFHYPDDSFMSQGVQSDLTLVL